MIFSTIYLVIWYDITLLTIWLNYHILNTIRYLRYYENYILTCEATLIKWLYHSIRKVVSIIFIMVQKINSSMHKKQTFLSKENDLQSHFALSFISLRPSGHIHHSVLSGGAWVLILRLLFFYTQKEHFNYAYFFNILC